MSNDKLTSEIAVPSEDPEKKEDDGTKDKTKTNGDIKGKGKDDSNSPDISEEDLQLQSELEMLVERLKESDTSLYLPALESLRTLIRTSTSSMTSVPKPLKFLRPHYEELEGILRGWNVDLKEQRSLLSSILSILAMTYSDTGKRDTLYYRLTSHSTEAPGLWGHEYVRHLAAELGEEYNARFSGFLEEDEKEKTVSEDIKIDGAGEGGGESEGKREYSVDQLRGLAIELVDFCLKHNAEADAVDLLLELEYITAVVDRVDDKTWPRVCQYMVSCVPLLVAPDDSAFLKTAAEIYAKHDRYPEAVALAVRLNDERLIRKYYEAPANPIMKKQLSYFLARSRIPIHWVHNTEDGESLDIDGNPLNVLSEDVLACLGNTKLSNHFRAFGKAVSVFEPKVPEDIYKTHLETTRTAPTTDSARQNLAGIFVNAFVNAGFGNDKLIVDAAEGQSWIYKNKEHGMMSATASIGMSMLWDSEAGIDHVDKYSYSAEEHIKAGAFLAMGILHSNIRSDPDVAFALLEEHVNEGSLELRIAAMNGIGIAYAGSCRPDISNLLLPLVAVEEGTAIEVSAMAALALGFVFVGSGDGEITGAILQKFLESDQQGLDSHWAIFLAVALGLIFLGRGDDSEPSVATLGAVEHPIADFASTLLESTAYAGTGNVLKIQTLLAKCGRHAEKPKKAETTTTPSAPVHEVLSAPTPRPAADGDVDMEGAAVPGALEATVALTPESIGEATATAAAAEGEAEDDDVEAEPLKYQGAAVIGIALVAMGEEVGAEMCLRHFQHLMTYGDPTIRKSVPLALALISASNPQVGILDTLSKYSHDSDLEVAANSIIGMGIVGAGTNNARLAQMLRALAVYYAREADCSFLVRIAQGLVHMGKGTIGLNPFYHDGQIMSRTAVAGILSVLVSLTEAKSFILGKQHWMLYWLVTAMYPQFLITLDENLEEKATTVRVGQAVNTVGLAGTRSGISGFQTHQTPVRIGTGERAELGTNEFFPYQSVLEGLVILKKNEQYDADDQ